MSTQCWRCAPPSVMSAGRRPGKRSWRTAATNRPCGCGTERLRACSSSFPLCCSCSCSSVLPPPSLLASLPFLLPLLPPCLVPLALRPIIPGNEPLPATPSWLQKNDGHPLPRKGLFFWASHAIL